MRVSNSHSWMDYWTCAIKLHLSLSSAQESALLIFHRIVSTASIPLFPCSACVFVVYRAYCNLAAKLKNLDADVCSRMITTFRFTSWLS